MNPAAAQSAPCEMRPGLTPFSHTFFTKQVVDFFDLS